MMEDFKTDTIEFNGTREGDGNGGGGGGDISDILFDIVDSLAEARDDDVDVPDCLIWDLDSAGMTLDSRGGNDGIDIILWDIVG